ncbi:hypothetical protein JTB14_022747 [Gonioctena quinquepunctata]|nr:hypothetical protein JTB14_022747 [Gonioctena quinquepunctata]
MALALNEELNCEKKNQMDSIICRGSTSRNNISGYPIQETDMVDEDPEDVEMPGNDIIPEDDSDDSIKDPDFKFKIKKKIS